MRDKKMVGIGRIVLYGAGASRRWSRSADQAVMSEDGSCAMVEGA